jgi:hypothetical protein
MQIRPNCLNHPFPLWVRLGLQAMSASCPFSPRQRPNPGHRGRAFGKLPAAPLGALAAGSAPLLIPPPAQWAGRPPMQVQPDARRAHARLLLRNALLRLGVFTLLTPSRLRLVVVCYALLLLAHGSGAFFALLPPIAAWVVRDRHGLRHDHPERRLRRRPRQLGRLIPVWQLEFFGDGRIGSAKAFEATRDQFRLKQVAASSASRCALYAAIEISPPNNRIRIVT